LNWARSVALAAASNQHIGKDRSDRGIDVSVLGSVWSARTRPHRTIRRSEAPPVASS
jgi:hypothetical protein